MSSRGFGCACAAIIAVCFVLSPLAVIDFGQDAPHSESPARIMYASHSTISIDGNSGFNNTLYPSNGVASGNGTASDPYIISGWDINASSYFGICIWNTDAYFIVRDCYVHDGGLSNWGVYLSNCANGFLSNNTCSNNYYGISLYSSSGNTLNNNTCSGDEIGIFLYLSSGNTLNNNTCSNNQYGMYAQSSSGNTLINNTCSSNNWDGIRLTQFSNSNDITRNQICKNSAYGIRIEADSVSNRIWNSTFAYNNHGRDYYIPSRSQGFDDSTTNHWNSSGGSANYGNFWSDWSLPDDDSDGIVDMPYNISGSSSAIDFYPFSRKSMPDSDADGMIDAWEMPYLLNYLDPNDRFSDADLDGLSNLAEYENLTSPQLTDTDSDGMPDGWELQLGFNPLDATDATIDSDGDGLTNSQEYQLGSNIYDSDTDDDTMPDGWEAAYGLNLTWAGDADIDSDADELTNIEEFSNSTNPKSSDTDSDGMPDGWEVNNGFDPLSAADAAFDHDSDDLPNLGEYQQGSDAHDSDTDDDTMPDGWEDQNGLNPLNPEDASWDSDSDGLSNLCEYLNGTDLQDWDTDNDYLSDSVELVFSKTDPLNPDTDGNGVADGLQFIGAGGYSAMVQLLPDNWIGMQIFWSSYTISVKTNSSVLSATFNKDDKTLTIGVSGPSGTMGACQIVVPKAMINSSSDISVFLDDQAINFTLTQNDTYYTIDITYAHSTHELMTNFAHSAKMTPPLAIPLELVIGALIAIAAILTVALVMRDRKRPAIESKKASEKKTDAKKAPVQRKVKELPPKPPAG